MPILEEPDEWPWTPELSASCPTLLWAAHLVLMVHRPEAFVQRFGIRLPPSVLERSVVRYLAGSVSGMLIIPPVPGPTH